MTKTFAAITVAMMFNLLIVAHGASNVHGPSFIAMLGFGGFAVIAWCFAAYFEFKK